MNVYLLNERLIRENPTGQDQKLCCPWNHQNWCGKWCPHLYIDLKEGIVRLACAPGAKDLTLVIPCHDKIPS